MRISDEPLAGKSVISLDVPATVRRIDSDGDVAGIGAIAKDEDEWLFNTAGDVDGDGAAVELAKWNPGAGSPALAYVRVPPIPRTNRRDLDYFAPPLISSEDKDFAASPNDVCNTLPERRYRRRQLQTVVDMRNLS